MVRDQITTSPRQCKAHSGQNLVEFAMVVPLFLLWLLVSIQVAIIVVQEYSLMRVTRETARWLAIRPDTLDTAVTDHARANHLSLYADRITSVVVNPSCTTLVGGHCGNRPQGTVVRVTTTYDVGNQLFLPTTFRLGWMTANIPTSLPPYSVSVTFE